LERAHLNGGFARAAELGAAEVRTDVSGAEALAAAAESAVEHMNADHREALALYATRLAGERAADWRATGVDPDWRRATERPGSPSRIGWTARGPCGRCSRPSPMRRAGEVNRAPGFPAQCY
jgi:hypothetical protein